MTIKYKLIKMNIGVRAVENVKMVNTDTDASLIIPFDPANTDYQAYLKWLEEGNTPEPADVPAQGE